MMATTRSGSLNSRLAEPFVVEVVDANDNPVEDVQSPVQYNDRQRAVLASHATYG